MLNLTVYLTLIIGLLSLMKINGTETEMVQVTPLKALASSP